MKKSILPLFHVIVSLLLIFSNLSFSQVPDFTKVPNLDTGDSVNIMHLIKNGIKIKKEKVICWFPKDSLSERQMNEIADTISIGIKAAEKLINAPLPWQAHNIKNPFIFYFRLDTIISHASFADFVSVSFWRIKNGKAPWLHEVLHEMLSSKIGSWFSTTITEEYFMNNMHLWLFEGLPDYISLQVSKTNDLPRFDVFSNSHQLNVDSLFLEDMKSQKDSYTISYIGNKGVMPELFSKDRIRYAPAFYHGSCSFVKYIADNYGIEVLLNAVSSFEKEQQTIENLCGRPITILKKEWLDKIKMSN